MIHAHGRGLRTLAVRLQPGEDLRQTLHAIARQEDLAAAVVTGAVGSLLAARLRFAGCPDASMITGDLEICTLSGTLSVDGPHLHITMADATGVVTGGHVLDGCIVRTTLELVVLVTEGLHFLRRHDPATGHDELAFDDGPVT